MTAFDGSRLVIVGTYSGRIHLYGFTSGRLTPIGSTSSPDHPSFLEISADRRHLYAVGEGSEVEGRPGAVSAFLLDDRTGALQHLNTRSTLGSDPCHLRLDRTGRYLLAANYGGGSVAMMPVQPDGSVGEACCHVRHEPRRSGRDPHASSHPHAVVIAPGNRYALVPDLGLDKVFLYELDLHGGRLNPAPNPHVAQPPGSGPRHFAFHPGARYGYLVNELANTVTAFHWTGQNIAPIQQVSTLPEDHEGTSFAADIHVHPNGRFLYASNRGHDSIVVFAIDPDSGRLKRLHHAATGRIPRNFALDPDGDFLLVANQSGGNIVVYAVDAVTGSFVPTGEEARVAAPVCVVFSPAPRGNAGSRRQAV
jgi:6-phosphogluconolactonase